VRLSQAPSISLKYPQDDASEKEAAKGTPGVDLSASAGDAESDAAAEGAGAGADTAFGVLASDEPAFAFDAAVAFVAVDAAFAVDYAAFAVDDAAFAVDDAASANSSPQVASAESAANVTSAREGSAARDADAAGAAESDAAAAGAGAGADATFGVFASDEQAFAFDDAALAVVDHQITRENYR
jgi:hypothetical protein